MRTKSLMLRTNTPALSDVIVYILILLVFVFANFNFDKWIFLDVLWIPT